MLAFNYKAQLHKPFFIALNLALAACLFYIFFKSVDTHQDITQHQNDAMRVLLKEWNKSKTLLQHIRHRIEHNEEKPHNIIIDYWNEGSGLFRYNWFDTHGHLIQNSVMNIEKNYALNIVDRRYFLTAKQFPGHAVISTVLEHKSLHTQFIAQAIAIQAPDTKSISGVLTTVYPVNEWEKLAAQLMKNCGCDYRLLPPPAGTFAAGSPVKGFTIAAKPSPHAMASAYKRNVIYGGIACITLLILVRMRKKLAAGHKPAQLSPADIKESDSMLDHLSQHCRELKSQTTQLHEQNARLSGAFNRESSRMLMAVDAYRETLENKLNHDANELDPYDLDDILETAENLDCISAGFQHFSRETTLEPLSAESLNARTHELIERMQPWLERRNMTARLIWRLAGNDSRMWPAISVHIVSLSLFLALRYAEDESLMTLEIDGHKAQLNIRLSASQFRQSLLPPEHQDFSMFSQAYSRDMSSQIEALLEQDTNWLMIQSLLLESGGKGSIAPDGEGFLLTLDMHQEG